MTSDNSQPQPQMYGTSPLAGVLNTTDKLLEGISNGLNNSRSLSVELNMSQEYIRRLIKRLNAEGKIKIIKEPRGHTYKVV